MRPQLLNPWGVDALAGTLPVLIGVIGFGIYAPHHTHPWAPPLLVSLLIIAFAGAGLRCAMRLQGPLTMIAALLIGCGLGNSVAGEIIDWHSGGTPVSPTFRATLTWLGGSIFWSVALVAEILRNEDWVSRETACRRCAWATLLVIGGFIALTVAAALCAQ